MTQDDTRIAAARLAAFVTRALTAAGLSATDAETVAGLMTEADLRGSDTHGVIRLPLYVRRIRAGGVNAKPNIRVVSDRPSAALQARATKAASRRAGTRLSLAVILRPLREGAHHLHWAQRGCSPLV